MEISWCGLINKASFKREINIALASGKIRTQILWSLIGVIAIKDYHKPMKCHKGFGILKEQDTASSWTELSK